MPLDKPVTLVHPDGREFTTSSPAEVNNLVMAHGYTIKGKTTLADVTSSEQPAEKPKTSK